MKKTLARKGDDTMAKQKNLSCSWKIRIKGIVIGVVSCLMLVALFTPQNSIAADLMHNSADTGSTKWPGGWGVAGGRYGKFTCATCHEPNAMNIKHVRKTISVMNNTSTTHTFPNGLLSTDVNFRNMTSMGGNDNIAHSNSNRICQTCHSKTLYQNADSSKTLPENRNHPENKAVCTSCHIHNTGFKAACGGCHGNPPTSITLGGYSGMVGTPRASNALPAGNAGAHRKHAQQNHVCNTCHYISDGTTKMPLLSNTIQIGFYGIGGIVTSGTYVAYSGANRGYPFKASTPNTTMAPVVTTYANANKCTNLYCHGGGVATGGNLRQALTGGSNIAPSWSGTGQAACGTCHGATASSPPTTGSHITHSRLSSAGNYQIGCSKCHPAYTPGTHVQGKVSWHLDIADPKIGASATYKGSNDSNSGQLAPSASYGQCSNINCHGDGRGNAGIVATPTWGDTAGFANCVGCHGGSSTSAYPLVHNAHKAHIKNESVSYSGVAYGCVECHSAVVTNDTTILRRSLHVNGAKNVSWGPKSTGGQVYSGNCANIYCHSNGQGTFKTPGQTWVGVTTDGQEGTASCNYCHGGQAGQFAAVSSNRHRNHILSTGRPVPHAQLSCAVCHVRTVSADGTTIAGGSAGRHINRTLDVNMKKYANLSGAWTKSSSTCAATYCHGNQPVIWTNSSVPDCEGCHRSSNYTSGVDNSGLSKAHIKHYNTASVPTNSASDGWSVQNRSVATNVFTCGVCHPTDPATTHVNGATANGTAAETVTTINLPFSVNNPAANLSNTVIRGNTPINSDGRGFQFSSGTTCTTYCHSNGKGGAPITVASWSSTTMNCGDCHNKQGDASPTWSGSHTGHLNSIISDVTCNSCHAGTASGNNTLIANRRDRHPNGFANVTGNNVAGSLRYNGDTCSSVYCHPTQSPSWEGGTLDAGCESCHGGNVNAVNPMDTKGHRAHVHNDLGKFKDFNFKCYECHFSTVDSTDQAISTKANHINGSPTVAWGPRADGVGTVAYNPTVKCTTYCHSNGLSKFKPPPKTWNSMTAADEDTIRCDYCHGGIVGYGNLSTIYSGEHTRHLYSTPNTSTIPHKPATCNECHSNTVAADGMSIYNGADVKHINKQVDVSFMKMGNFSGSWTKATTNCSNTWCHGSRSRLWPGASITCGGCHASSRSATFGLSSSHVKHYNSGTNATAANGWTNTNSSTTSANIFRCGMCHPGGNGPGEIEIHHVNGPAAANGSAAEVVLWLPFTVPAGATRSEDITRGTDGIRKDSAGYQFSQGTTCDTYCHSDAKGGPPKLVMRWSKVTASCGNCHNKAGDDPANTTYTTWSKPHNKHATAYGNGGSLGFFNTTTNNTLVTCAACHSSTATNNTTIKTTGGFSRHPNGFRNISASTTIGSAAFRWDVTKNQCKNGYCHSNAYSFTDYSTSWISWSDSAVGTVTCGSCHISFPNGPSYASGYKNKKNSHQKHAVSWGFTCDYCHNNTVAFRNATSIYIKSAKNHVNKRYDVIANGTKTFVGLPNTFTAMTTSNPQVKPTTCSNVNCHGAGSARTYVWGGTNRCGDCHFASVDKVNYAIKNSTMAMINRTEWSFSGHGKESGTYQVTANRFGGFSSAARLAGVGGDPCLYCHIYDTVQHGDTRNPMRLRNYSTANWGRNGVCMVCHVSGDAPGVTPGAGYRNMTATRNARVDKTHFYDKHSSTLSGGQLCWDCHDSHGDRTATNNGPIAMIQSRPAKASNAVTGVPTFFTATTVRFTAMAAGSDFGKTSAPFNGVCNVCHTYKAADPNKMVHYTDNSYDGSHYTTLCTACHKHSPNTTYNGEAYKGDPGSGHSFPYPGSAHVTTGQTLGNCTICHSNGSNTTYPVTAGNAPDCTGCHKRPSNETTYGIRTLAASSCWDCHGSSNVNGRPNGSMFPNYSGSHTKHVVTHSMTCASCHGPYGGGIGDRRHGFSNRTAHTFAFVNVTSTTAQFRYTATGKGSCSNITCHSNAQWGVTKLACNSCHSYLATDSWTTGYSIEGVGSHVKHIQYIQARWPGSTSLNPATDVFGAGAAAAVCGVCHTNTLSDHSMNRAVNTRTINLGNPTYPRQNGGTPTYWGTTGTSSSVNPKSCSNIDCHYLTSPIWMTY